MKGYILVSIIIYDTDALTNLIKHIGKIYPDARVSIEASNLQSSSDDKL